MKISKPEIVRFMIKNMTVKCPHCGWLKKVPKTAKTFKCRRCHQFVEMDKEYEVSEYY